MPSKPNKSSFPNCQNGMLNTLIFFSVFPPHPSVPAVLSILESHLIWGRLQCRVQGLVILSFQYHYFMVFPLIIPQELQGSPAHTSMRSLAWRCCCHCWGPRDARASGFSAWDIRWVCATSSCLDTLRSHDWVCSRRE